MNRSRPQLAAPRRATDLILDMAKNVATGGFDVDAWHAMNERDNLLIAEEILHGAQSSTFIYRFSVSGKEVVGVSVIGARHLASYYGGLRHRLVSSVLKTGALHIFTSFAGEGQQMQVDAKRLIELSEEDDYYSCVAEITDVKIGNTIQVEARETRFEFRKDGSQFERPHFQKIAQSKAYRNGVLALLPQDLRIKWQIEMMKLNKEQVITDSVIDTKRAGILTYCAANGIPVIRDALEDLTMAQIAGLSEAARSKDKALVTEALTGLGLMQEEVDQETGEVTQTPATPAQPIRRGRRQGEPKTPGVVTPGPTGPDGRPEPPPQGELVGATGPAAPEPIQKPARRSMFGPQDGEL